jgi:hypothetical protein
MNQSAMRLFVRTLITEAKAEKSAKLPKSSGKLMDLKKELAALEQMKEEIQAAKFAEKTAETEVEFANLSKFAKELDKIKAGGVALEASIDAKIEELKGKIDTQKNKIKEMIGMTPAPGQEKMVDEKKEKEEHMEEARFKKGTDIGKPGKGFEKIAKSAAKQYGSKEAGKKVAGAILKKVVKEELDTNTVYSGAGQNTGNSGSSLQFKIIEKDADGVIINYTITPNSKQRQAGAGDKSSRVTKKGHTTIKKSDVDDNGYIKLGGENFRLDKNFLDQLK